MYINRGYQKLSVGSQALFDFQIECLRCLELLQIFSLKAEAFLKQRKPENADTVLLAAQKVEDGLRKCTSLPADTTTLLVQAQIDMALGR